MVQHTKPSHTVCICMWWVITFPLPFLLLHTTHSSWPGRPLAVGGTFSGKCLLVRRRGVVLLHLGQQIVLQGQQKEPQSPHLPVRVDLLPAQRENSRVGFREDCLDSPCKMYAFTMAVSIRWKKTRLHHFTVRWLKE